MMLTVVIYRMLVEDDADGSTDGVVNTDATDDCETEYPIDEDVEERELTQLTSSTTCGA